MFCFSELEDDQTAQGTYTVQTSTPLGTTSAGTLTLNGVTDSSGNITTVDLNNNSGFNISNITNLVLNNIQLTGASGNTVATVSNEDAQISLNNSVINGNIAGSVDYALITSGNTIINGNITGTGMTTVSGGETTFNGNVTQSLINIISGTSNIDADNVNTTNGIANAGVLNLGDGTLCSANMINGSGSTNITGIVTSNATINQTNVTIGTADNTTAQLESNAAITADIINWGTFDNNAPLTGMIINKAGGTFINNDNVAAIGGLINDFNMINNTGSNITANNMTNNNVLNNNGTITLKGSNNVNNGQIYGDGTFIIDNNSQLYNSLVITQNDISVNNGAQVITAADKFNANNGVTNNGEIIYTGGKLNSNINGNGTITVDYGNEVNINSAITGNTINLNSGVMSFGRSGDISQANAFNINGGGLSVADGIMSVTDLGNVNLAGNADLAIDFNLSNLTSDSFTGLISSTGGVFNVNNVQVFGNPVSDYIKVHLGDTTNIGRNNLSSNKITLPTAMTPIRKLFGSVDDGWLTYMPGGNSYNDFNPSVFITPVAMQATSQVIATHAFNTTFEHSDIFMQIPFHRRIATINSNLYALSPDDNDNIFPDTYLYGTINSNYINGDYYHKAAWFKPYTSIDKIELNNGPKFSILSYGTMFGGDSNFRRLKHGWANVGTVSVGYNASQIKYDNVDITTNGGLIGITESFYKNNFFTGITAHTGLNLVEGHNQYGRESSTIFMGGLANKIGYNFELQDGKYIIQPNALLNWSIAHSFGYTNAGGVKINANTLSTLQLIPQIKVIANLENGWQPYAFVGLIWNAANENKVKANNIELPKTQAKSYLECGLGIQKYITEYFSGYGQATVRCGGRNGIALSFGFRLALGKHQKKEKIHNNQNTKVIKQPLSKRGYYI